MNDWLSPARPLSIAHRGASAYAKANSMQAFEFAAVLGADMWEIDLHLTADGHLIAYHDFVLTDGREIRRLSYGEIRMSVPDNEAPLFQDVVALARECDAGLYADIKAVEAALPVLSLLSANKFERAILGAFAPAVLEILKDAGCPYPRAALIPVGADPFAGSQGAEIIHLCWESLDRPQDLLDETFFARCEESGQKVVLWHEEDPVRMADLRGLPVLGICSDRPELVKPFRAPECWPVQVVCHRGANTVAPENTLSAAVACYAGGFSHVEIDVRVTADGALAVIHDATLERTSDGKGDVSAKTLSELRGLSAGAWFSDHHAEVKIPTLAEVLILAESWSGRLYIELKSAPADLVWRCVCERRMAQSCFFWSFDPQSLEDLRSLAPDAQIMVRRQDFDDLNSTLSNLSPALVEYTTTDDLSELSRLREYAIPSMIAYNGSDPAVFELIENAAPDMVNLNHPFEFARFVRSKGEGRG